MRIFEVIERWHLNDYSAIMKCEFCGSYQTDPNGYDDLNYHNNVIPIIECLTCKKSSTGSPKSFPKGVLVKPVKEMVEVTKWVPA